MVTIDGFVFNDFCGRCRRVTQHKIVSESGELYGVCVSCNLARPIMEPAQVHYTSTDLWVTRFKVGNLQNGVTGRLLDAVKEKLWKKWTWNLKSMWVNSRRPRHPSLEFSRTVRQVFGICSNILELLGNANRILWSLGKFWRRNFFRVNTDFFASKKINGVILKSKLYNC